jgi:hypothetical protein
MDPASLPDPKHSMRDFKSVTKRPPRKYSRHRKVWYTVGGRPYEFDPYIDGILDYGDQF